jgi:hypothetical protein
MALLRDLDGTERLPRSQEYTHLLCQTFGYDHLRRQYGIVSDVEVSISSLILI